MVYLRIFVLEGNHILELVLSAGNTRFHKNSTKVLFEGYCTANNKSHRLLKVNIGY